MRNSVTDLLVVRGLSLRGGFESQTVTHVLANLLQLSTPFPSSMDLLQAWLSSASFAPVGVKVVVA